MHYVFGMHVVDGLADALENPSHHSFVLQPVLSDVVEEGSIFSVLQNNISAFLLFIEIVVQHLDNVRMVEFHMDLDLTQSYLTTDLLDGHCLPSS